MTNNLNDNDHRTASVLLAALIAANYSITLSYGEGDLGISRSRDKAAILAAMGATDEEWLRVFERNADGTMSRVGTVSLIYGNGKNELVSDHSTGNPKFDTTMAAFFAAIAD